MNSDVTAVTDEDIASALAAYDNALAAGNTPASNESEAAPEVRSRIERNLVYLHLLDQLRPGHREYSETPQSTGGDDTLVIKPFTKLGRFQIHRLLGRGGYGVVYLGYDPDLQRPVALKIPRLPALASPELHDRFRQEARAAASLDHTNIVQVYEAGEVGPVSYIASAYCPGTTLAQWLSERRQPVPERDAAQMVATLADAVQHAHSRGVLHRDLKPGNVLLQESARGQSPDPEFSARITDFGLAKVIAESADQTRTGEIVGTPAYMSPEQAEGKPGTVTTAADIYALGAILYELLTGRPPFQADSALATLEKVRTGEPARPRTLRPGVAPDVETICLKCLEKDPGRRYPSAHALAEDLHRFLEGEPIQARPVGLWERAMKWARRRPAVAASLGVTALALLGLLVGTLWNNKLLRDARTRADHERQRATENFQSALQAVDRMLTEVGHKNLAHQRGLSVVRQKLLNDALGFYQQFMKMDSENPMVRREAGQVAVHLARVHELLGQHPEAEQVLTQAIGLQTALCAAFPRETNYRADLAHTYDRLGLLLHSRGRSSEAEKAYQDALGLMEPLDQGFPNHGDYAVILASVIQNLGMMCDETGRAKEAEQYYLRAIAIQRELHHRFPEVLDHAKKLAGAQHNLAHNLMQAGRLSEAEELFIQVIAVYENLVERFPTISDYRETLARSHYNRGRLYRMGKRLPPAEEESDRAITHYKKLADDFPEVPNYRLYLAGCYTERARLLNALGRIEDSLTAARDAVDCQEKVAASFPNVPRYRQGLGIFRLNWGTALVLAGRHVEAQQVFEQARDVFDSLVRDYPRVPDYRSEFAVSLRAMADLCLRREEPQQARSLLEQAVASQRAALETNPDYRPFRVRLLEMNEDLAKAHLALKSVAGAAAIAEEMARTDPGGGQGHYVAAAVLARCAGLTTEQSDGLASAYADRCLELLKEAIRLGYPDVSRLRTDSAFEAVRARPDFQAIVKALERPA
jgi:serine/threonine protein kinase